MFTKTPQPETIRNLTQNIIVAIIFNLENKNSSAVLDELLNDNFLSDFLISWNNPANLQEAINDIYPSLISARGFQNKLLDCRDRMLITLNNADFIKAHTRLEQVYEPDNEFFSEIVGDDIWNKYESLVEILNFTMPVYQPEILMF